MTTHERDYLERTIATVRNHRDAENCWPSWANIFADEIERLWKVVENYERHVEREIEPKLMQTVERYREALEEIESWPISGYHAGAAQRTARAVLAETDSDRAPAVATQKGSPQDGS